MNELEQKLYEILENDPKSYIGVYPQYVIGPYRVDFVVGDCAIEIDGHDFHKTKEQRDYDYKRERYLIKNGFVPVRFMATEVFLDVQYCADEIFEIANKLEMDKVEAFHRTIEYMEKKQKKVDKCQEEE